MRRSDRANYSHCLLGTPLLPAANNLFRSQACSTKHVRFSRPGIRGAARKSVCSTDRVCVYDADGGTVFLPIVAERIG